MAIKREDFAFDCTTNALKLGVNPHYLVAIAELLSGIKDDKDGDRVGPFRRKQDEWNAKGSEARFSIALQPADIDDPIMQCTFAALQTLRAQEKLLASKNGVYPTPDELYAEWPKDAPPAGKTLNGALDSTRPLILPAVNEALEGLDEAALIGEINVNAVPAGRHDIAKKIMEKFAAAGYGKLQQVAALANAIAESNLNPSARNTNPPEDSVGLFQLNRNGGVGTGHSVEELTDPDKNIDLIIGKANSVPQFKAAVLLSGAVDVFVRKIEQPGNQDNEVIKRLAIAQRLVVAS